MIQIGDTFGENKIEAKPLKKERKESGGKKVRFHKNENSKLDGNSDANSHPWDKS
jgi:hypothetical protein